MTMTADQRAILTRTLGACFLLIAACTMNPATGQRQLTLMSEAQEIQIGEQTHPEVLTTYGAYDDAEWQTYIQQLGEKMAAVSERPNLDWTFTVLDDPVVNAMALPGGFIYVNRGILAHFNSEAELASVLGHEIGHVTDRRYLDVKPKTIDIVELPQDMTLADFAARYPSTVKTSELATINGVNEDTVLEKGRLVKRIVGGKLPESSEFRVENQAVRYSKLLTLNF